MRASPSRWRLQVAGTQAVSLVLSRENSSFRKENERKVRPNVISFELITKQDKHWLVISWYVPPVKQGGGGTAADHCRPGRGPAGSFPLFLGDLNADLKQVQECCQHTSAIY